MLNIDSFLSKNFYLFSHIYMIQGYAIANDH